LVAAIPAVRHVTENELARELPHRLPGERERAVSQLRCALALGLSGD
jgi:hypothetical protein